MTIQENIFLIGIFFIYLFILLIIFGFGGTNTILYYDILNYFMKLYICLFIIIKFNPFTNTNFTNIDKKIVFTAALLLLSTTTIQEIVLNIEKANKLILDRI